MKRLTNQRAGGLRGFALLFCAALLTLGLAASGAEKDPGAKPDSSSKAYDALVREFDKAMEDFQTIVQAAKTDAEREKAFEKYPQPEQFAGRFLKLAEADPKSSTALDALVWIASHTRSGSEPGKAVDLLVQHHLASEKLGDVSYQLIYSDAPTSDQALRTIREKSPHRPVQGKALFSLAQRLMGHDKAAEAEKLFEEVAAQYADVTHWRGTLGDAAKAFLFEMRNLVIGKVAPDIEGEDVEGVKFKLSDQRGKVVVLDFWGDW